MLSKEPKYRPRKKYVSIKWHHFREHIKQGTSNIVYIETNEQQLDIITKPLDKPQIEYLRNRSWDGEYSWELCSTLI